MAHKSTGFLTREEKEINWHRNFEDARMEINHFPNFGGWIVQGSHLSGSGETRDEAIDDWADNVRREGTQGMRRELDKKVTRLKAGKNS